MYVDGNLLVKKEILIQARKRGFLLETCLYAGEIEYNFMSKWRSCLKINHGRREVQETVRLGYGKNH